MNLLKDLMNYDPAKGIDPISQVRTPQTSNCFKMECIVAIDEASTVAIVAYQRPDGSLFIITSGDDSTFGGKLLLDELKKIKNKK